MRVATESDLQAFLDSPAVDAYVPIIRGGKAV